MFRVYPTLLIVALLQGASARVQADPLAGGRTVDGGTFTIVMPGGWSVTRDPAQGLVVAQQDPGRKDAAQMLFLLSAATSATEDQVIDMIAAKVAQNVVVVKREPLPGGGGRLLLADAITDGIKVRVGAIAVGANGGLMVGLLIARHRDFDVLGGLELVSTTMGTVRAARAAEIGPAAAAADAAPLVSANGRPAVPPPPRAIALADLVGEWKHNDGSWSNYVSRTTGQYVDYRSIQFTESWTIGAGGALRWKFHGASSSGAGVNLVNEDSLGSITIADDGTITVATQRGTTQFYLLRGWLEGPGMTVMKINGPWYAEGIPADIRADPQKGYNLDEYWVRPNGETK